MFTPTVAIQIRHVTPSGRTYGPPIDLVKLPPDLQQALEDLAASEDRGELQFDGVRLLWWRE